MSKQLTIGMPAFSDYDGCFFSLTSLKIHHAEAMKHVEFLVVDGNPDSEHGNATANFCRSAGVRYIPAPHACGTAQTKQLIFDYAQTEWVLCMDCHVLFDLNSIRRLVEFMETDDGNLLQGPLIYDDGVSTSTHFEEVWRGGMLGIWAKDPRGLKPDNNPFEIRAQGMGVFACKKETWPGFNPLFRGFGGEECYIHEKMRQQGRTTYCLPFLRWHHRFGRPGGIPYPSFWEDRIFNYIVGHIELGMPIAPVLDHFETLISPEIVWNVKRAALDALGLEEAQIDPRDLPWIKDVVGII